MSEEVKQEGDFKIKKKQSMKKLGETPEVIKVDLSSKKEDVESEVTRVEIKSDNANKEQETTTVVEDKPTEVIREVETEVPPRESTIQDVGFSGIEEVTEDEVKEITQEVKEAIRDERVSGKPLPENIEKLVTFMEETGGNLEDYVRLNADYSSVDSNTLLKEYYRKRKPHLDDDEIKFLLEDNFSYDEELDEEEIYARKNLHLKKRFRKPKTF